MGRNKAARTMVMTAAWRKEMLKAMSKSRAREILGVGLNGESKDSITGGRVYKSGFFLGFFLATEANEFSQFSNEFQF